MTAGITPTAIQRRARVGERRLSQSSSATPTPQTMPLAFQ